MIGASLEVLKHHAQQHIDRCGEERGTMRVCPCGATAAICCARCDDILFLATSTHRPPCRHARPLLPAAALR